MERVDEHLNNLCSNKISVVTLFNITNTTTTETQPCPTSTNGISMTDTSKITNTCVPSCSTTTQLQTTVYAPTTRPMERQSLAKPALPILVLGALLALSILLLVIVITGWVHTCVTMKMNRVKNSCAKSRYTIILLFM